MTALDSAISDYRILEGTSTISPYFVLLDPTFYTRASTTLFETCEVSDGAIDTISRLKSYLNLEENWDSYGGLPPRKNAVDQAISFVLSLDRKGYGIFFTAPGPSGEILIELKSGNKTVEVTFDNEKNVTSALFIGDRCIEEGNNLDERKILRWLI
jgi:hypothetical protein